MRVAQVVETNIREVSGTQHALKCTVKGSGIDWPAGAHRDRVGVECHYLAAVRSGPNHLDWHRDRRVAALDRRGITFTQVHQWLGDLAINMLAASPVFGTDSMVLVATSDGVFRSTDGSVTWSATTGIPSGRVGGLVFSPRFSTDNAVYAITDQSGVFRSSDRGVTWNAITTSDLPRLRIWV